MYELFRMKTFCAQNKMSLEICNYNAIGEVKKLFRNIRTSKFETP